MTHARANRVPTGRGAILLECVLALAVFVGGGLAILTLMDRAAESVRAIRDVQTAADIAASAMAQIEAGILSPEAMQGEVHKWMDPDGRWGESPAWQGWRVEVDAEPAAVEGLTVVTIHVLKEAGTTEAAPLYDLRQVVTLRPPEADGIGAEDPLAAELESGAGS